jgi:hypothetical protein
MTENRLIKSLNENKVLFKEFIKLMGDASTRVYYRVFLNDDFTSEKTFITMVLPEKVEVNEKGNTSFIKEEPFMNLHRYLIKSDLNIPEIYLNDEKNRVVLLEDLSDMTLYKLINKESRKNLKNKYKKAIDELIEFQDYTLKNRDDEVYAFKRSFDETTLKWELDHFVEWRIKEGIGVQLSINNTKLVDKYFDDIVSKLLVLPQIVVHRDYQSKNIMIKDDSYYLIDFQDALIGSYVYDLVALLKDSYVELSEDFVVEMLKYYIQKKKEKSNIEYEFEVLYNDFKLQAIQRKLKDTGRFHFIDIVRKNPSFLEYLPLSQKYVREYLSDLYPELYEIFFDALK